MSQIAFYNQEVEAELEKISAPCDFYRLRVKDITSDIYEKTKWAGKELERYQYAIIKDTYIDYCEAMSEKIILYVSPIAYRHAAEKNDLEEYVKREFLEYAHQYKAYCLEAISQSDSIYDVEKLLKETIKRAVLEPWKKASKKVWRDRVPLILGAAISMLVGWLLNAYGAQVFTLIKKF